MKRPNILYLHSHDTGRCVQPCGYAVPTPNLQCLAEQGVLFRQAYCASPTCGPSRACLLTGQSAHACGKLGQTARGFPLEHVSRHLVRTLKAAGYLTALAGIQHEARSGAEIGYDQVLGPRREGAERGVEFLDACPGQPFFLSVGLHETHRPFPEAHPEGDARWCLPPAPLPDAPDTREDMGRFKASARVMDRKMGAVLDALERNNLAGNTLVICTTDHGPPFPGMKCSLADGGIGVMLVMRGPGGFGGGRALDALVSHVDICPTLCELLGIEKPGWLEGVSLLPLVLGEAEKAREEIFAEINYHAAYEPVRCVRTERYKYIRRYAERSKAFAANIDDSPSKDLWMQHGWHEAEQPREALYDLMFDPCEACNLAGAPSCEAVLRDMRARLLAWQTRTGDPLLSGPVPAPPGARITPSDALSPHQGR